MIEGQDEVGHVGAPSTLELARTPGHLIRRAQRVHTLMWAEHVGVEPTGPQFAVLSCAARRPGSDQKTLGALASLDKSTTADVVRRLVRHRWLTTTPDPTDRRRNVLHLSPPARAALQGLTARAARVQRALLAPLAEGDATKLIRDLAALAYEGEPPVPSADESTGLGLELSRTPGHLIRRAQQAHTSRWSRELGPQFTGPQYAVLCALADRQPTDQVTVGEAASLDRSSTAEVVERLSSQGLVTVAADPADRRRKALRLSDRARAELPGLTAAAARVQTQLLDLLPAAERAGFLERLAAVAYQAPVAPARRT